jgi:hypothetical protein
VVKSERQKTLRGSVSGKWWMQLQVGYRQVCDWLAATASKLKKLNESRADFSLNETFPNMKTHLSTAELWINGFANLWSRKKLTERPTLVVGRMPNGKSRITCLHTFNEDHDLPMHVQKAMNPALNEEPGKREAKFARPTQKLFPQEGGISCA